MRAVLSVCLGVFLCPQVADAARLGHFLERLDRIHADEGEDRAEDAARRRGMRVRREGRRRMVAVILEPAPGGRVRAKDVRRLGGYIDARSADFVRAVVPMRRLRRLESLANVSVARAPTPLVEAAGLGPQVSESAGLTGATALQDAGVSGAGIHVAVVDLGFIGAGGRGRGGGA